MHQGIDQSLITSLRRTIEANDVLAMTALLDKLGLKEGKFPNLDLSRLLPGLLAFASGVSFRGDMEKDTADALMSHVITAIDPSPFAYLVSTSLRVAGIKSCKVLSNKTRLILYGIKGEHDEFQKLINEMSWEELLAIYLNSRDPDTQTVQELCKANLLPPHMVFAFMTMAVDVPEIPDVPEMPNFSFADGPSSADELAKFLSAISGGSVRVVSVRMGSMGNSESAQDTSSAKDTPPPKPMVTHRQNPPEEGCSSGDADKIDPHSRAVQMSGVTPRITSLSPPFPRGIFHVFYCSES